jgi:ketol-acid reductoisomerase
MLVGYNTNISYKGDTYHIQTEDSGVKNPVIVTLLYSKGAILASKKTSYSHIIENPDYKEKVKRLMKEQHKEMIKDLLAGKYTGEYTAEGVSEEPVEQPGEEPKVKDQITRSLDDILLNYITKRK